MGFFNIIRKKEEPIKSYEDFWNWFQQNEKTFFKVVMEDGNIVKDFLDKIACKLNELKDGFYYLAGKLNENTAELILTADGIVKNIVFVEELLKVAPKIDGWKFTVLKPPLDICNYAIEMEGYVFSSDNLFFYSNDKSDYPDEIDLTIAHNDFNNENSSIITKGIYIFLENFLGELNFITTIDAIEVTRSDKAQRDLIPIEKLKDYLIWRQKEFIEKYKGVRYNTDQDSYFILEGDLENGSRILATINQNLLSWDRKASHPWIAEIEIKYDGIKRDGMPNEETYLALNEIEDNILEELKDVDGYLNIGRKTAKGVRTVYFACQEFRKPSMVLYNIELKYSKSFKINYDIFKDKYWQAFKGFEESH
ncbi:MAG: DUF695 domain-containing protein [Bacteroidota bacterium]